MKIASTFKASPFATSLLLLLPLALLALIYLIPNHIYYSLTSCRPSPANSLDNRAVAKPEFRLLVGIMTLPDKYERRHLMRYAYSLQRNITTAQIDIRFVFCNLTTEEQRLYVSLEIMHHDDIIILNCTENLSDGKSYVFYSSLPTMFGGGDRGGYPLYDYVMKSDDDTYFRLDALVEALKGKPKKDMYFGCGVETQNRTHPPFMLGMGYIISWDLVEWIAKSEYVRNHSTGVEDIITGMWLNTENRGKNRYNNYPLMYNYRGRNPEDFEPGTIAVHLLKELERWTRTLNHFNVTKGLKPSKLYHIP
ncbi:beta-1,3-galactosyltransferase pvg3-like [Typha latifolia]|uniref:beta-1,3-galactosyltransferase pvg3-like n=1 Tax=Typha latifolia TaxID=4733 RepID=UPI003C2D5610